MESYIPGKHIRFCCKHGVVWVQARCYQSLKKNYAMHQLKLAISSNTPHTVPMLLAVQVCVAIKLGY